MKNVITLYHVNLKESIYQPLLSVAFCVCGLLVNTYAFSQLSVSNSTSNIPDISNTDIESLLHYYDHQIFFTENKGQWDSNELYRAEFPLGQALVTKEGMLLATFNAEDMQASYAWGLKEEEARKNLQEFNETPVKIHGHGWRMEFVNASPQMSVQAKQVHKEVFNYFMGDNAGQTNVKSYQEIWYNNVYEHVDVRYYPSAEGSLEYDIICKPGFDKNTLAIRMAGITKIKKQENGSLIFRTSVGDMEIPAPIVYQIVEGKKIMIDARYRITDDNIISFDIGSFDKNATLIIDPIAMRWATWVNSNSTGQNHGHCIWVDQSDGAIYIVARVDGSTNFITVGAFDVTSNGHVDLVIGKYLEPDAVGGVGSRVWQTYVGGNLDDNPYAMEQGPDGELYIAGYTGSSNYPLSGGLAFSGSGIDNRAQATDNIFITKINTSGNSIKSAVIGGNGSDGAFDLRTTADGNIVVCGNTRSTNLNTLFPGVGATNINYGGIDAIIFKINTDLDVVDWINNYGGSGLDQATIMLVNQDNADIFVAGYTNSSAFPTLIARQSSKVGGTDGYIQKFNSDGTMVWSSYFNSALSKITKILCMEFNGDGSELIFGGITNGLHASNISASGVYDNSYNGGTNDLFIVNMDTSQTFNYATYIGGSGNEVNMMGMNVDDNNDVFVFGYTDSNSPSLTATFGALQTTNFGINDKIFLKLSADLSALIYLTYYGGSGNDYDPIGQRGIKTSNCRIYTIITAQSKDIPLTEGALNTNKISSTSIYEPGLVVWANPPDLINNEIFSDQILCPGQTPEEFTGSEPDYVLPVIIRDGTTSVYPDIGTAEVYQWQYSLDSITWIDVPGGIYQNLDPILIGPIDTFTYFRRIIGGDACISIDADHVTITVSVLNVDGTITDPLCYDAAEGSITLIPAGSSSYSYVWSTGDDAISIDGLIAGDYFAVVTDALGCSDTFFATITDPAQILISETHENVNISCGVNGSIDLTVTGGSPAYTFLWEDGSTDEDREELSEGIYSVIVTDVFDCTDTLEIEIGFDTTLACLIDGDLQFCNGGFTTLTAPDGFDYLWSTGEISQTIEVYAAGFYSLTITNNLGCTAFCDVYVVELSATSIDQDGFICEGEIYILPDGSTTSITGDYSTTLVAANGCDSIIITHLFINPTYVITNNIEICEYESYTMPDGSIENSTGTYIFNYTTMCGCDSNITINLNVDLSLSDTVEVNICEGDIYTLPDGVTVNASGTYISIPTVIVGCDSIIVTLLTVNTIYDENISAEICDGETYILPDGSTATSTGIYVSNLFSIDGCDSIITTDLIVNPIYSTTVDAEICDGETYILPDGTPAATSGIYVSNLISINGCDSIITTDLIVNPIYSITVDVEICDGEEYILPDGSTVATTGIYISNLFSINGCDSIITTDLIVHPVYDENISAEICNGETYFLPDGSSVSSTGIYITNLISINGCDSIITTDLIVHPIYLTTVDAEICDGETYILPDGSTVSTSGIYISNLFSINGCDSIITTDLIVHPIYSTTVDAEICDGATYILPDGTSATTTGIYISNLFSIDGCDSIITIDLIVHPVYVQNVSAETSDGQTYILPDGSTVSTTGIYITNLISINGCDSIITTDLIVHPVYDENISAEICDGETYILPDGSTVATTGIYISNLFSINGCDSIITTDLIVHPVYDENISAEICNGETYFLPDGSSVSSTGIYITNLISINGCDSIITTDLIVHSIYLTTVDAEICDGETYILPDGSTVATTGIYISNLFSINGCDSIITTDLIVHPIYSTTVDAEICDGETYILPDGTSATTTGIYISNLFSIDGCDSIITIDLIVHPVYVENVSAEICDGETYILPDGSTVSTTGIYVSNLFSIDGCDSIITTDLIVHPVYDENISAEICDGETYILPDGSTVTTTGIYISNLFSINGCDSIITTDLIVHPVYNENISAEICDGETYILPDGSTVATTGIYISNLISINGCDSIITTDLIVHPVYNENISAEICDGEEYILPDGTTVTTTGIYITNLISINGCDSIITTDLIVHPIYSTTIEEEICDGETYILPDGSTVSTSGIYISNLISINGCDSIITTDLIVHSIYSTTVDAEICDGETYFLPDGSSATTSGIYISNLFSINGCDSIITTDLIVHSIYSTTVDAEICDGETYFLPDGSSATTSGIYISNLISINGCDSIITTALIVNPIYDENISEEICDGEEYILADGSTVATTGIYITNLFSINGCDSIITTDLIVHPIYDENILAEICDGATYILPDGTTVSTSGIYISNLFSINGCDSIITTDLIVHPVYNENVDAEICDGEEYILPDGTPATTSGIYISNLFSINGCDSIITTDLIVHSVYSTTVGAEICDGETYILPDGTPATTSGIYISNLISINGCDSIITTDLIVHPIYDENISAEICDGATYILPDGTSATTTGIYISNLFSIDGCDSIITIDLIVHPVYVENVSAEICDGETYILPDGSTVSTSGIYISNLFSINGCDSIITTDLIVHPIYDENISAEICDGETYILPGGSSVSTTGIYISNLISINGCDSIITTDLIVHPIYNENISSEICDGEEYILPDGSTVTTTGIYITNLFSINGCDSIITTDLIVHPIYNENISAEICDGEEYILPDGSTATSTGIYISNLISINGCDSIITTDLIVHPVYSTTVDTEICDGEEYILPDGSTVTTTGIYITNLFSFNGCDSIITTDLIMHPVYNENVDAEICDGEEYILPDGTSATTAGIYISNLIGINGCDSIITTDLIVHPVYSTTIDAEICDGATYILPDGSTVATTGIYITNLFSINGCDSIITTDLIVHSIYVENISVEICDGEEYILPDGSTVATTGIYITNLFSINGCDSIITTDLIVHPVYNENVDAEICDGDEYILPDGSSTTTTGIYITNLFSINGCDSIITTDLIVHPIYSKTVDAEICDGETYILPDGSTVTTTGIYISNLISINGCDSIITTDLIVNPIYSITVDVEICDGEEYILPDGSTVATTGIYISNLISINGCDSIITTDLIVNPIYSITVDVEICDGEEYILPDGSTVATTGIYITNLFSINGCDSIITTDLIVNPIYDENISAEICDGATYILPDGTSATTTGIYISNLFSIDGCDSIITIDLIVHPVYVENVSAEICDGETYILPDGSTVSTSGIYISNLFSINGCDSIITTDLIVHPIYDENISAEICDGETYILPDGTSATTTGIYITNLFSINGCDSIITTDLIVHPVYNENVDAEICDGEEYILPDGSTVATTGIYITNLFSINGCDSIITTDLIVHPVYNENVDAEICDGETYILPDGSTVSTSGIYISNLFSINGCDSIITTDLIVHPIYVENVSAEICDGETYILPDGSTVITSGIYISNLISINGCDSIITTDLIVHPIYNENISAEICDGSTYILPDGSTVATSGIYITNLFSINGCDSIITTDLIIHPIYSTTIDAEICDGETYILPDGTSASTTGIYISNLFSINGCDSIITTDLIVNPIYSTTVDAEICDGETYILPDGTSASTSGIYISNLISINGCDSIITTDLIVHPIYSTTVDAEICDGEEYILPDGTSATTSGIYVSNLFSSDGCDSIITTDLIVNPIYSTTVDAEICDGETYILPDGSTVTTTGIYISNLFSIDGCDSIITTDLIVHPVYSTTVDTEICDGETYILLDGTSATTTGIYITNLISINGCDSIITTDLIVHSIYSTTVDAEICDGEEYILPDGSTATSTGIYITNLISINGCDSIITTDLIVHPIYNENISAEICDGETYILPDGTPATTSGIYISNLISINGCDSIITTDLIVHPIYDENISAEICDGETYILPGGSSVSTTGIYISNLISINGCDSIITTDLIVNPIYDENISAEICDGEEYILPDGTTVATTGIYITNLFSINGCDSIITTDLIVHPIYDENISAEICDGETYVLPDGTSATTTGIYITNLISINGCDSIITTDLIVNPLSIIIIDAEICIGEGYLLPDGSSTGAPGEYNYVFINALGCDSTIAVTISVDPDCDQIEVYDQDEIPVVTDVVINPIDKGKDCDSLNNLPYVDIANDTLYVYLGEQVELLANVFGGLTPLSFQWEPANMVECPTCPETNTIVNQTVILTFTATDTMGCKSSDDIILRLLPCDESLFEIPNIMSPNGDGLNDEFYISYEGNLIIKQLNIFNRWGEVMFQTRDLSEKWNGTFNGILCNPGVYVYTVDFICSDGTLSLISGNITLVK
ncbi:MAG: gliding motility-associated C-terminal domain-containing protein [Bacteroidetes bacterium]|nr:gliding motility-associated C-terminal domain-containing protein [Bacteroidota bacterium]